jgi:hypothetical protein
MALYLRAKAGPLVWIHRITRSSKPGGFTIALLAIAGLIVMAAVQVWRGMRWLGQWWLSVRRASVAGRRLADAIVAAAVLDILIFLLPVIV